MTVVNAMAVGGFWVPVGIRLVLLSNPPCLTFFFFFSEQFFGPVFYFAEQ